MRAPAADLRADAGALVLEWHRHRRRGGGARAARGRGGDALFAGWHRARERAAALAAELDARPLEVDLADAGATRAALRALRDGGFHPDVFIHCAAVARAAPLAAISDEDLAPSDGGERPRGADRAAGAGARDGRRRRGARRAGRGARPHAIAPAAADRLRRRAGALGAITMAAAKELGPQGIRVNLVALGLLEGGLSGQLAPSLSKDYTTFSALHRLGQPQEAARAILWLALENTYVSGKILSVNGGI